VRYEDDNRAVEYAPVRGVSPDVTVYELKELYVGAHRLGVPAALLALRLAGSAPGVLPSEEQEAQAVPLNNTAAKLCEVGVADGSWLLAVSPGAGATPSAARALHCTCLFRLVMLTLNARVRSTHVRRHAAAAPGRAEGAD
jgi:hypothetical protein